MKNTFCYCQIFAIGFIILLMAYIGGMSFLYPMQGDDFAFACFLRDSGVFSWLKYTYCNWTLRLGEIFNIILLHAEKSIFNFVNPFVQLALAFVVFSFAFQRNFNWKKHHDYLFLALIFAMSSVLLARPRDTVFWMTGANVYAFGLTVWFGFWGWIFLKQKAKPETESHCWLWYHLAFIFGFTASWVIENAAVCGVAAGIALIIYNIRSQHKISCEKKWALSGYFTGFLLFVSQPGRWSRLSQAETHYNTLLEYISLAVEVGLFHIVSAFFAILLIGFTLFLLYFYDRKKLINELRFSARYFILSLVSSGCFIVFRVTPAMRGYLFSALLFGIIAIRLLKTLWGIGESGKKLCEIICIISLITALGQTIFAVPDFIQISRDSARRAEIIKQGYPNLPLTVPAHNVIRQTFFQYIWIEDITSCSDNSFNQFYAKYYNLSAIKTVQNKTIPIYWKKGKHND